MGFVDATFSIAGWISSRIGAVLLLAIVLAPAWWAIRYPGAARTRRRVAFAISAIVALFLYLPPFGTRLRRPELDALFEPEVAHGPPTLIQDAGAVWVQIQLERPVPPWFANTYIRTLERRGIEIDATGTSPFAPFAHQTGWTIRGLREVARDPYTVEHFTSRVQGTSSPAKLRWPWLYLRLGADFLDSFQRSVVIPRQDAVPNVPETWRYPGAVATYWGEGETGVDLRFIVPARRREILAFYRGQLGNRYRVAEDTGYETRFRPLSPADPPAPEVTLDFPEAVGYCACEAPSLYTTEGAEERRRVPPLPTYQRRSQQSVLLPNLPLLTQVDLKISYGPTTTAARYAFLRDFKPLVAQRLDGMALAKGRPFGALTDDGARAKWLAAADLGFANTSAFTSAVSDAYREPFVNLRLPYGEWPEMAPDQRIVMVPPASADRMSSGLLRRFVLAGGVVAAFRQNQGYEYSLVPVPEGEPLLIRGSRDSKSHYGGARVNGFHPVLSSLATPVFSMLIDGVIERHPKDAIVLVRSLADKGQPALVLYRVGKGWVAAGPLFGFDEAEYGPASGTMLGGLDIVRDLVTWATDPETPIPAASPGESVRLHVNIVNRSAHPSAALRLRARSPSRDRLFDTRDVTLVLPPAHVRSVSYEYALPADSPLGIGHVDFQLLDAGGRALLPEEEAPSGRVAIAIPALRALPVLDPPARP